MPFPDELLTRDETVTMRRHPHWKVLIAPIFWLVVLVAASVAVPVLANRFKVWPSYPYTGLIFAGILLLLAIWQVLSPIVRWRSDHFAITSEHVFIRTGVFSHRNHEISLSRVLDVQMDQTMLDRIMRSGTLTIESVSAEPLIFENVAGALRVQQLLSQRVQDDRDR